MTEHEIFWMASLTRWNTFEQAPGVGDRQGSLARYNPWGHKVLDMTEQLNSSSSRGVVSTAEKGIQLSRLSAFSRL